MASAAIAIALGLGACGGGGGSSSSGSGGGTPPPAGNTFGLNGATAKGLILSGAVKVTDTADDSVLVTGTTSATDGSYDVTIPTSVDFDGPFVKVTVTGVAGATMICDAPAGCGAAGDFGDAIAVDDTVSISAIIPAPADKLLHR